MFIVVGQTPEATRKRLEPPRIVCDLSAENAICDPRANVRKVAEMFRKLALFNYAALKRTPVLGAPARSPATLMSSSASGQ
jgi:hypothetical protein